MSEHFPAKKLNNHIAMAIISYTNAINVPTKLFAGQQQPPTVVFINEHDDDSCPGVGRELGEDVLKGVIIHLPWDL